MLYTEHVYAFEIASVILLLAIVAAITLTMRKRPGLKVQDIVKQVAVRARGPRAHRQGRVEQRAMIITTAHYLVLAAVLFSLSVAGIFLNRKNVILLLMCIELMLLAVNFNFIAFSRMLGDLDGPGVRVLHSDGGGCRSGDRPRDPGGAVPQHAQHQRRRPR